jgi:hypothetical protein
MKTYSQLKESLRDALPWEQVTEFTGDYHYEFKTPKGKDVQVYMEVWDEDSPLIDPFFKEELKIKDKVWNIKFSTDGRDDITNGGEPFKILATVKQIFETWLKKENPKYFSFESNLSEPSRIKTYKFFAKMISSGFGYKLKEIQHDFEKLYTFNFWK